MEAKKKKISFPTAFTVLFIVSSFGVYFDLPNSGRLIFKVTI